MTVSAALSVTRRGLTAAALAMLAVPLAPAVASAAPATNLWISLESPGGYWGATGDQVTGEAADWWVAVMNSGPGTVDGSVTVTMPAGLQVVPTFPATVTTTPAGGTTITWQELTFSNGQQRDYTCPSRPRAPARTRVTQRSNWPTEPPTCSRRTTRRAARSSSRIPPPTSASRWPPTRTTGAPATSTPARPPGGGST